MNIKKVLLTVLFMNLLALLLVLTGCGDKKKAANQCIPDQYGYCQGANGPIFGNPGFSFPFYQNASISNRDGFKKFMNSEFGIYARCHDYFSADCRGLQVLVQAAGGTSYNIVLRGLAVNQGINFYAGNSYFNNQTQNAASTVNFHAVAQATRVSADKVIVRLQGSTYNSNNPFGHYDQEHTRNHVYLETDGLLSQEKIRFTMFYNSGRGAANPIPIATGILVKGRDIL